ncbi:hypothetical protein Nepgr_022678 [Nepenthes gracilis]|uniref:Bifunctional inhibitor/plant lipid transfer protein/seed storage helical domain-containing protein n=1 Tax=Nepenthes gracilis TaxID=150966 RepID=A0AAD3XYN0_NEPGR|nr:hypothetical protein Nepgr_022678 [Nepenthes gracilis]
MDMGKRVAVALLVVAVVAAVAANGEGLCGVEVSELLTCRAAVTQPKPSPPSAECCKAISHADLPCLCRYKPLLARFGVDPSLALALPVKCGLPPPPCRDVTIPLSPVG